MSVLRGEVIEVCNVPTAEGLKLIQAGLLRQSDFPYVKIEIDTEDGYTEEIELPLRALPVVTKGTRLTFTIEADE